MLVTSSQDNLSSNEASKTLTLGTSLWKSMALIIIWISLEQYFAFKERITPWSNGWVTNIVFLGKKTPLNCRSLPMAVWARQLSTINKELRFRCSNFQTIHKLIPRRGHCPFNLFLSSIVARQFLKVLQVSRKLCFVDYGFADYIALLTSFCSC